MQQLTHLQEEQPLAQSSMSFTMQRLPNKESQFVGILAGCRNADRSAPIVVHVRQLVREQLVSLGRQSGAVFNNVVHGRADSAFAHTLRDQVEIKRIRISNNRVDNCSGLRVLKTGRVGLFVELSVMLLRHDNEREFDVRRNFRYRLFQLFHFVLVNKTQLTFANSVAVEKNVSWQFRTFLQMKRMILQISEEQLHNRTEILPRQFVILETKIYRSSIDS